MSQALKLLLKRREILANRTPRNGPSAPLAFDPRFQKQNAFVESQASFIDAQCSRRAGKSSGLGLRYHRTMQRYPGSTCIYTALTFDSARSIMWPVLQELDEKHKIGWRFFEGKLMCMDRHGAKLRLYGADQKNFIKRLKGQKAPGIAIDEAQDFGAHLQSLIDDVLTPMMADYPDAWLALTGTPGPIPRGYFYEVTKERKFGYEHHEWTLNENPYMPDPEGLIQKLITRNKWALNNPTLMREWRNQWVLDPQGLWIRYNEEANHFEELPRHVRNWNYICGVDLGYGDADAISILAWSAEDKNIYLVEELVTAKQGLTPLVNQVKAMIKKYDPYKIVIDTGGGGKKMAEEMRQQYGIPFEAAIKQEKQQTVEFLNDGLRLGRVKAKKDSRFAQDSYLIQIDWEKSSPDKIVVKANPHSDIIDSVIYGFRHSPFYLYEEPKIATKPGTKEHDDEQSRLLFEHHVAQLEKTRAQRDGEPAWPTDANGIPPWLKFDE